MSACSANTENVALLRKRQILWRWLLGDGQQQLSQS